MEIVTYQETIRQFANYHKELGPFTVILSLGKHYGDICEKLHNILENKEGGFEDEDKVRLAISIGDAINDLVNMSSDINFSMDDILNINLKKLQLENEQKNQKINTF